MSSKRLFRRKGVVSSGIVCSRSNSLDWDSPSTKTGTVKRRPASTDCSSEKEINHRPTDAIGMLPTLSGMNGTNRIHKATLTSPVKNLGNRSATKNVADDNNSHFANFFTWIEYKTGAEDGSRFFHKQTVRNARDLSTTAEKSSRPSFSSCDPLLRHESDCCKAKEVNNVQESFELRSRFKVDGFGFDNPKWPSLTESNAYLIERKASGFNLGKAGIVSDSDSGIASPLSPSSLYGFLVYGDKNEGSRKDHNVWMELERLRSCSCVRQQVQVLIKF